MFVDETAKDSRHACRRYAWAKRGEEALVSLPFVRGERVSVLASFDINGFFAWSMTFGTYTRKSFHNAFYDNILPYLNPWPLPRSILILDNAKIHMYAEFEGLVHATGALLFFLPPYSPQLNPIETGFSLLKRWIQRNAHLAFQHAPEGVLQLAMIKCTQKQESGKNIFAHSGYKESYLDVEIPAY